MDATYWPGTGPFLYDPKCPGEWRSFKIIRPGLLAGWGHNLGKNCENGYIIGEDNWQKHETSEVGGLFPS